MAKALDGYDWLLNHCVDGSQAEHAAHLDEDTHHSDCFHCQCGDGRPAPVADPSGTGETR